MRGSCPWPTKPAFEADKNGARQQELRALLGRTVREQTEFIMERMERALPKMLAAAPAGKRAWVNLAFGSLKATPEGVFCLIDYVNFKGEGTSPKERYQGPGLGPFAGASRGRRIAEQSHRMECPVRRSRETRPWPPGGERTTGAQGTTLAGRMAQSLRRLQEVAVSVATRPSARS
jgi:hypothetical protein